MNLTDWKETFTLLYTKKWRDCINWRNELASKAQIRGLNILIRDGLLDKFSRDVKIGVVSRMIGREIESTNELQKIEAHILIEILMDDQKSGEDGWVLSEDGKSFIFQAEMDYLEVKYSSMVGAVA